ncbi:hypothetical protein BDW72DRAFT_15103 [Aspergillus terricola var. indicus]
MDTSVNYLLTLQAVRERAKLVWEEAQAGNLSHFNLHLDNLNNVADYVASIIKRDFGPDKYGSIPPHGRWQHFEVGGIPRIANLIEQWKQQGTDDKELARRLIDLFFVSVLLDAGAGDQWRYKEPGSEQTYERSEGIAVASYYMFTSMVFASASSGAVSLVDGEGLKNLTGEKLKAGFQVSEANEMLGVESRAALLNRLGESLLAHPQVFGREGRPGNAVDYMLGTADSSKNLDLLVFWDVLQALLVPIWPSNRTSINGLPVGDSWPLSTLQRRQHAAGSSDPTAGIQPFHKLTQWLTYSLMVPFERILGMEWKNADSLTALAEYRNGGLFVDLGVLALKKEVAERGLEASPGQLPLFDTGDDVIVEWRAMTVALLDVVYPLILAQIGDGVRLTIAQVLEAGTWKAGRELAAQRRPSTKSSPILIQSDGTVF